jgi:hypothetical protein
VLEVDADQDRGETEPEGSRPPSRQE